MTLATTIDLVRHADVHNPRDVFYGRLPRFRLSDLGRRQAAALAAFVATEPLAMIYSSPMLRARQTAQILHHTHPDRPRVRISRLLIEVGTQWQGRPSAELDAIGFDFFARATEHDERIVDVFGRMERVIRRLVKRHAGQRVVCVSHGDPIMIARVGLLGRPLQVESLRGQDDYPAKASVSRLVFDTAATPTLTYLPPPALAASAGMTSAPTGSAGQPPR